MGSDNIIHLETTIAAEIWREIGIAKAKLGNDWLVQSIVNSWGATMDDRETLQAIPMFNQTGSMFATIVRTVH